MLDDTCAWPVWASGGCFNDEATPDSGPSSFQTLSANEDELLPVRQQRRPKALRNGCSSCSGLTQSDIVVIGERLRLCWHEEGLIVDKRRHFTSYQRVFVASAAVKWLVDHGEAHTDQHAINIMRALQCRGLLHHVRDDYLFTAGCLLFRFRRDDGTLAEEDDVQPVPSEPKTAEKLYKYVWSRRPAIVKDYCYKAGQYRRCMIAKELVDAVTDFKCIGRAEAVQECRMLLEERVIVNVDETRTSHFKDSSALLIRFAADGSDRRRGLQTSTSFRSAHSRRPLRRQTSTPSNRGSNRHSNPYLSSSFGSANCLSIAPLTAQNDAGVHASKSLESACVSAQNNPKRVLHVQRSCGERQPMAGSSSKDSIATYDKPRPLRVLSLRHKEGKKTADIVQTEGLHHSNEKDKKQIQAVCNKKGWGFTLRGSGPVYVDSVDKSSMASLSGLEKGDVLLLVNGCSIGTMNSKEAMKLLKSQSPLANLIIQQKAKLDVTKKR